MLKAKRILVSARLLNSREREKKKSQVDVVHEGEAGSGDVLAGGVVLCKMQGITPEGLPQEITGPRA